MCSSSSSSRGSSSSIYQIPISEHLAEKSVRRLVVRPVLFPSVRAFVPFYSPLLPKLPTEGRRTQNQAKNTYNARRNRAIRAMKSKGI